MNTSFFSEKKKEIKIQFTLLSRARFFYFGFDSLHTINNLSVLKGQVFTLDYQQIGLPAAEPGYILF